ncbi:MAG: branched-chain-amino-acid transaminase [Candidatus Bathyarchaeia archaeon]|nr:branched-chain-amino-acid transaminase [Candidatus Bathyarchaeota archaeon]
MQKEPLIYINGEFYPKEEAKISVFDHGLLYGDGVFEAIRAYDGIVFKLKEHIDRLFESAKSIKIDIGISKEKMQEIVLETLKKNNLKEAYIRIVVTRGKGPMGVDPRNCEKPTIIIIAEPREPLFGKEKPVKAIISSLRRVPRWALDPRVKSLNYLNNILAKIEAIAAGVEEAIMLNQEGYVAEGSTENIFIVKGNEVATPPPSAGILKGITRDVVIEIAKELGYEVKERDITIHELYTADEVFVCGTGAEVVPIVEISGRTIGNGEIGPVYKKIKEKFKEKVKDPKEGVKIE